MASSPTIPLRLITASWPIFVATPRTPGWCPSEELSSRTGVHQGVIRDLIESGVITVGEPESDDPNHDIRLPIKDAVVRCELNS